MARELVHKRLDPGTLVLVNRLNEYGIVIQVKVYWGPTAEDPWCYTVLVRGEEVSAYGGGLTIIGDS